MQTRLLVSVILKQKIFKLFKRAKKHFVLIICSCPCNRFFFKDVFNHAVGKPAICRVVEIASPGSRQIIKFFQRKTIPVNFNCCWCTADVHGLDVVIKRPRKVSLPEFTVIDQPLPDLLPAFFMICRNPPFVIPEGKRIRSRRGEL